MKVQKVQAFQSQDGCLWENEAEAIEQNINDCISTLNHNCGNSGGDIYDDIKKMVQQSSQRCQIHLN